MNSHTSRICGLGSENVKHKLTKTKSNTSNIKTRHAQDSETNPKMCSWPTGFFDRLLRHAMSCQNGDFGDIIIIVIFAASTRKPMSEGSYIG